MSDDIYDPAFLDRISGYDVVRKVNIASEQDALAVQRAEWAEQDRQLNELMQGWDNGRGTQLKGFEFVPVTGVDTSTKEGHEAMVRARKDFERGVISAEQHRAITAALKKPETEIRGRR